jgi:hypothetical protein
VDCFVIHCVQSSQRRDVGSPFLSQTPFRRPTLGSSSSLPLIKGNRYLRSTSHSTSHSTQIAEPLAKGVRVLTSGGLSDKNSIFPHLLVLFFYKPPSVVLHLARPPPSPLSRGTATYVGLGVGRWVIVAVFPTGHYAIFVNYVFWNNENDHQMSLKGSFLLLSSYLPKHLREAGRETSSTFHWNSQWW